jgi:hypothetical protein
MGFEQFRVSWLNAFFQPKTPFSNRYSHGRLNATLVTYDVFSNGYHKLVRVENAKPYSTEYEIYLTSWNKP